MLKTVVVCGSFDLISTFPLKLPPPPAPPTWELRNCTFGKLGLFVGLHPGGARIHGGDGDGKGGEVPEEIQVSPNSRDWEQKTRNLASVHCRPSLDQSERSRKNGRFPSTRGL